MIDLKKRYEVFCSSYKLTLSGLYVIATPIMLWFSYRPALEFGVISGMHLKLSLPLLYLLGFVALFANEPKGGGTSTGRLLRIRSPLYFGLRLPFLFTTYALVSLFWARNPLRSAVEVGVLVMLMCAYAFIIARPWHEQFWSKLVKVLFATTLIMSALAIFQVFWGAFSNWGLCGGCLSSGFGFARPSLFAIEPQFLGSLLLLPVLLLFYKFIRKETMPWETLTLLLSCTVVFLTLSRGAIYAMCGGGLVMLIIFLAQKSGRRSIQSSAPHKALTRVLASVGFVLLAFALSLGIDTAAMALNPQVHEHPLHAPAKIISQLSLGKVNLMHRDGGDSSTERVKTGGGVGVRGGDGTAFDGYVEASTNEREYSTNSALEVYQSSPWVMLFGVGAGSSGAALQNAGKVSSFEIVQNQYFSTLLELGAVGLVIFISIFVSLCVFLLRREESAPLVGICIAFLLQWYFFSGFPNALHVYLGLFFLTSWGLSRSASTPHLPPA